MLKRRYSTTARRAMNIIWNAAGSYDFTPPYTAFFPDGESDTYFNMILGFSYKWLDLFSLTAFFDSLGSTPRSDEARAVLWLGVESAMYRKELAERPALLQLRVRRAEKFFSNRANLSRQQMMLASMKVFNQEEARWASVLSKPLPGLTSSERALKEELLFPPELSTDEMIKRMEDIAERYFKVRPRVEMKAEPHGIFSRLFRHKQVVTDSLIIRTGSGTGDKKGSIQIPRVGEGVFAKVSEKDEKYISSLFGPCTLSGYDMRVLENGVCSDADQLTRLWVSGEPALSPGGEYETEIRQMLRQKERNRDYFNSHFSMIGESVKKIAAETDAIFAAWQRKLPVRGRKGRLQSDIFWRLPVLGDADVFLASGEESEYSIEVDLLLDASQSRMNMQQMISAQARIIAEGFEKAGVSVRVRAFRSLRGYTVIQTLKEFSSREYDGLFSYFAGGWNRDSLCIKALDFLSAQELKTSAKSRIMLVLTDASPNDSAPLVVNGRKREYQGGPAVEETVQAVKRMRQSGIPVLGIFFGSSLHLENAYRIFGSSFVRVRNVSQLAEAVRTLFTDYCTISRSEALSGPEHLS